MTGHTRRTLTAVVAVAALASTLAACGGSSGKSPSAGNTILVGLEGPITGDQSSNGVDMLRAARLAASDINAAGGVLGKKLEIVPIDDKADPTIAKQVATAAIAKHIVAVVGPYNSGVGIENLPVYLQHGVVPIHLTSNSATNGEGFTVQPKDFQVAPIEAHAISGLLHAHRVAILYDPQTYTAGIAKQLRTALQSMNVKVVSYQPIVAGRKSYAKSVRRAEAARPDLVYSSTYYPEGGRIADATHASHYSGKCVMGLANQDPGFLPVSGLGAARACSFSGVPSPEQFPAASHYISEYRAAYHAAPGTWGTFTYDSVTLLADAAKVAGSWNNAAVTQQLKATRNYPGLTGAITIDPATGNRTNVPVVFLRVTAAGAYQIDQRWASFAHFSG